MGGSQLERGDTLVWKRGKFSWAIVAIPAIIWTSGLSDLSREIWRYTIDIDTTSKQRLSLKSIRWRPDNVNLSDTKFDGTLSTSIFNVEITYVSDVDKTSLRQRRNNVDIWQIDIATRFRLKIDVETTSCAHWVIGYYTVNVSSHNPIYFDIVCMVRRRSSWCSFSLYMYRFPNTGSQHYSRFV